ncbi:MAG: dihydroorotase [Betaproteobacteria bacterium]|nr:dihydroorotase [Betaproteobacteria bacterium]
MSANPSQELLLHRPDDCHLHLRDGAALAAVLPASARVFGRAIIMPNLQPPILNTAQALEYRARILAAVPPGVDFSPLMTLYLTDHTSPEEIRLAQASGAIFGVKLYPAGATTHSDAGVTSLRSIMPALTEMEKLDLPLLVHGEVNDPEVDIFDREQVFIDRVLTPIMRDFPSLRVVFEHITTIDAADYVALGPPTLAATITPQHLLYNRNALFRGGLQAHNYCLPVLKREVHRRALVKAATSGLPKFFLGTDSAPHARGAKESACGCAGCYTAPLALELYAEAFEAAGALDRLDDFASRFGAEFYRLPRATDTIKLRRRDWQVPADLPFGDQRIVPFRASDALRWKVEA